MHLCLPHCRPQRFTPRVSWCVDEPQLPRWGWRGSPILPLRRNSPKRKSRVVVVFLEGGLSQLESWDPKPNTDTGGPFKAIQTSVPGTRISELLPLTAKQMHRLAAGA